MHLECINSKRQVCELQYKMPVVSLWLQLRSCMSVVTLCESNLTTLKRDTPVDFDCDHIWGRLMCGRSFSTKFYVRAYEGVPFECDHIRDACEAQNHEKESISGSWQRDLRHCRIWQLMSLPCAHMLSLSFSYLRQDTHSSPLHHLYPPHLPCCTTMTYFLYPIYPSIHPSISIP